MKIDFVTRAAIGSLAALLVICLSPQTARAIENTSPSAVAGAAATPDPTPTPMRHKTVISLYSPHLVGDHLVETGDGHTLSVILINPITYELPRLQETRTSVLAQAPSIPTPPLAGVSTPIITSGTPLTGSKFSALSVTSENAHNSFIAMGIKFDSNCHTPSECLNALSEDKVNQEKLLRQVTLWNNYSVIAYQDVLQAANTYQVQAIAAAQDLVPSASATPTSIPIPGVDCVNEVAELARWTMGRGNSTWVDTAPSACAGAPSRPTKDINALFNAIGAWELRVNELRNQINANPTRFSSSTDPNVTAGINDATAIKSRLSDLDLSAYSITGALGLQLLRQVQNLLPFYDFDQHGDMASLNIHCHPHEIDGQTHPLTLIAGSRITTTPPISQLVGTIDCPGMMALSAGVGVSRIPLNSFVLIPINPLGTPAFAKIGESSQQQQIYGATLAHFFLFPSGDSQVGVFGTLGAGTSGQSFASFYGISVGAGRRLFLNALWENGSTTTLGPGVRLGETVPAGFVIPTSSRRMTAFTIGISFGGPPPGTAPAPGH